MPRRAPAGLPSRRRALKGLLTTASALLAGCSGNSSLLNSFTSPTPPPQGAQAPPGATIGTGEAKAGLILPLSAGRNSAVADQPMRTAASPAGRQRQDEPGLDLAGADGGAGRRLGALRRRRGRGEGIEQAGIAGAAGQ